MNKTDGKKKEQEKFLEVIAEIVRLAGIEGFMLLAQKLPLDSLFYSLLGKGMTPQEIAAYLIANAKRLVQDAHQAERQLNSIFKKENEPCQDLKPSQPQSSKTKKTKP